MVESKEPHYNNGVLAQRNETDGEGKVYNLYEKEKTDCKPCI